MSTGVERANPIEGGLHWIQKVSVHCSFVCVIGRECALSLYVHLNYLLLVLLCRYLTTPAPIIPSLSRISQNTNFHTLTSLHLSGSVLCMSCTITDWQLESGVLWQNVRGLFLEIDESFWGGSLGIVWQVTSLHISNLLLTSWDWSEGHLVATQPCTL